MAKSLNELYTEPAPPLNPFEILSTNQPQQPQQLQQQPQTPKLTRSVSTATDIFNNGDIQLSPPPPTAGKQLKENLKTLTNDMCGIRKNVLMKTQNEDRDHNRNSKERIFREIYNKGTPRKKPKDIYYIEDTSTGKDTDVYIIDPDYHQRNNNLKNRSMFSSNRSLDNRLSMRNNFYGGGGGSCDDIFADHNRFDNLLPRAALENRNFYQSRTLPRNFLKKSWDQGMDYDEFMGGRTSANGLFVPFRDDSSMLSGFHSHSRKAFEMPATSAISTEFLNGPKWPSVIARSPSNYSVKSSCSINNLLPPPSEFFLDDFNFGRTGSDMAKKHLMERKRLNVRDEGIINDGDSVEFDLDRIEQERRKSHANLFDNIKCFGDSYDYGKSTAV